MGFGGCLVLMDGERCCKLGYVRLFLHFSMIVIMEPSTIVVFILGSARSWPAL